MRRSSRRDFLKQTALAGAGFWLTAPTPPAAGRSPNDKLNVAIIGAGGRGAVNTDAVRAENIVALCDVDQTRLGPAAEKHPKARTYRDFRKLLDEARDVDAVVVSTTEHTHAFATLAALRLGKHVYCEKPLCHSIWETRVVTEAAAKAKVATQMGTQIHAGDNYRRVVELVRTGAVGPIRECHVWVSRDWGGGDRPKERRRCRRRSTGTCGPARRRSGRTTPTTCRGRPGTSGGTSATAPCPTSAPTGSTSPSGRWSCAGR